MKIYRGMLFAFLILLQGLPLQAATRGLNVTQITTETGEEVGLYQESHALLIGVSDYTAGWPDLPGVKKDVEAVKTTLESQGFQVEILENPTRSQLDQTFTDFITKYGQAPDNRLVFYFSGHGHTLKLSYGDEMGYIVPVDAPNPHSDEAGFIASALDMQMIEVYAKRIQSKHALFLFDSCFSGSIFSLSRAAPENISYKTAQPVRQFLTSGSAEEQVPDESIFRQQFIAALQGEGDANGDGYVTGTELGEFLQNQVVNYSKGAQHPQYGKIRHASLDKGDFVFQLPNHTPASAQAATTTQTAQTTSAVADPETEMWELVKNSKNLSDVQDFLKAYPSGQYAKVAELKLKQLERELSATPTPSPTPETERSLQPHSKDEPIPPDASTQAQQKTRPDATGQNPPELPKEDAAGAIPLPTNIAKALGQVREDLAKFREDLPPLVKKQDSNRFQEKITTLTQKLLEDIDAAHKAVESSPTHANLLTLLEHLRENVPRRMEELSRLAQENQWADLQTAHERIAEELVKAFENRATRPGDQPPRLPARPAEKRRP